MLNDPEGIIWLSVKKSEFIFISGSMISGPEYIEYKREQKTQAKVNEGIW